MRSCAHFGCAALPAPGHCGLATIPALPGQTPGLLPHSSEETSASFVMAAACLLRLRTFRISDAKTRQTAGFPEAWTSSTTLTDGETRTSKKRRRENLQPAGNPGVPNCLGKHPISKEETAGIPEKPYNRVFGKNPRISSEIKHLGAIDEYGRCRFLEGSFAAKYSGRSACNSRFIQVRGASARRAPDKLCSRNRKLLACQRSNLTSGKTWTGSRRGSIRLTLVNRPARVLDGEWDRTLPRRPGGALSPRARQRSGRPPKV